MANLQLVGAVGVRVRPDTKNFRRDAKREILAQLEDLEEDVNVRVNPNVQYNELKARQALRDAFKDIEADQAVEVTPNINDRNFLQQLRKLAQTKVPDITAQRIKVDTREAERSLSKLLNEIDDLEMALDRLPAQLENNKDAYSKTFQALEENTNAAKQAIADYERELEGLQSSMRGFDLRAEGRAEREAELADKLRAAVEDQVEREMRLEKLRAEYHLVKGKQAKEEIRRLRNQADEAFKASSVTIKGIQAEQKELAQLAKQDEREHKQALKRIDVLNAKLDDQRDLLKKTAETEKDRRDGYEDDVVLLEKTLDSERERLGVLREQAALEQAYQNARTKTNEELAETLDLVSEERRLYREALREGLVPSTVKTELDWLQRRVKDLTQDQLADLEEINRRRAEGYEEAMAAAEEEAKLHKELGIRDFRVDVFPTVNPVAAAMVEANMQALTRERTARVRPELADVLDVPIRVRIANAKSITSSIVGAVSGVNIARGIGRSLKDALRNLDDIALGAANATMAIGLLTGALGASLGAASALASDLGELSGALLMAPALVTALGSSIYVAIKGFEDFGAAMDGDAEALASFDENGQAAARTMGLLGDRLNAVLKPSLWRGIEDSMARMAEALLDPLSEGLSGTAEAVGQIMAGTFDAMERFASSGRMAEAFEDMNEGLREAAEGADPFITAINRMGQAGARQLPALGRAAAEAAAQFRDWSVINEDNGNFDAWIRQAVDHMKDLGSITADTVGIVGALGRAADSAGFGGLSSLADNLDRINEAAQGEFFQTNMGNLFRGALRSMEGFGRGLRNLGAAVLEQSQFIEDALEDIGVVAENSLTAVADALDNPRLLRGGAEFFNDLREASERLGPVMEKAASGLGDVAGVAGELAKGALDIADAFLTVWDNSENIASSLERLIPYLTDVVAGLIEISHAPITLLMDGLAGVIDGFLALPGPLRLAGLALAGLLVHGRRIDALGASLAGLGGKLKNSTFANTVGLMGLQMRGLIGHVEQGESRVNRAFRNMGAAARTGLSGMRMGLGSIVSFLGGPWGIALAGAGVALAAFGQEASNQRQRIEAVKDTFDEFGNATQDTTRVIAEEMNTMKNSLMDFDMRALFGDGPKNVGAALRELGMSSNEAAKMLVNDREAYDELATAMAEINNVKPWEFGHNEAALQRVSELTGISVDRLREMAPELANAGEAMVIMGENTDAARDAFTNLNGEIAPASVKTQEISEAFRNIADEASPAAQRVSALNDALAALRGEDIGADEAIARMHEEIRNTAGALPGAIEQFGNFMNVIGDAGKIDVTTEAGKHLYDQIKQLGDAAKTAYLETGNVAHLEDARNGFRQTAEAAGLPKEAVDELMLAWDNYAGTTDEIVKTVEVSGAMGALEDVESLANTLGFKFDQKRFEAWLSADPENAKLATEDAAAAAEKFANDTYLADLGVDKDDFDIAMAEVESRGGEWDAKAFTAWLNADPDNAKLASEDAAGAARAFADSPYAAILDADPTSAINALYMVDDQMYQWDGKSYQADLDGNPQPFIQKKGAAEGEGWLFDGQRWVSTLDGDPLPFAAQKDYAEGYGLQFSGKVFTADLDGNTGMIQAAKTAADGLGQTWDGSTFTSDLDGNNYPFIQKKGAADGVGFIWDGSRWVSTLDGDDMPAQAAKGRADQAGQSWDISRFDGHYDADTSGAWSGLTDALAAAGQWVGQRFTAFFDAIFGSESANGNLFPSVGGAFANGGITKAAGRVQKFADGGFSDSEWKVIGRAYANGGRENHRAMISRPVTPFRVWAEPETGGEAYIPLATSKRSRSTRIWEETGQRLGVDWEKYADGGFSGRGSSSSGSGGGVTRAGKVQNINVVNHYPQAEPTSTTVNKSLQFAANL